MTNKTDKMKIGVIVAMDSEYERLSSLLGETGLLGDNEIVLRRCGIGKVNSALGADALIREEHPDCIISSGVAGGLAPQVKTLDVVAATSTVYHDVWCSMGCEWGQVQGLPTFFKCASELVEKVKKASGVLTGTDVHFGLICSGDQFIESHEEGRRILSRFPEGLAVDMESCSIAQTCYLRGVPFISIRIISDSASDSHFEEYDNFWGTLAEKSFGCLKTILEQF